MSLSYKILLTKLLDTVWVSEFLDGNIYMRTDKYFAKLESSDLVRADKDEDVDEAWQVKEVSIQDADGKWVPIGGIINPILHRYGSRENFNLYCMHAIKNTEDYQFDERNHGFGNTAIIVGNAEEFIRRFKAAAGLVERELFHGPVTYVKRNEYHGPMGPFKKFDNYSYQNEFRFALPGGNGEPITLSLGNLRDICIVIPITQIPDLQSKTRSQ